MCSAYLTRHGGGWDVHGHPTLAWGRSRPIYSSPKSLLELAELRVGSSSCPQECPQSRHGSIRGRSGGRAVRLCGSLSGTECG